MVQFRCTTSDNTHKETGLLLENNLRERGVKLDPRAAAVVCYGYPVGRRDKTINGVGTGGKIASLSLMQKAGVRTVPWFEGSNIPKGFVFPALARNNHGFGGKDIVPVFQPHEVAWRVAAGFDWFSSYVPLDTEYRAWVFRGEVLDVYEKVMMRPHEYKHVAGRNFRQGFEFQSVKTPKDVAQETIAALDAIQYDFGAVDCLRGTDGLIYILEVNSAPGALRSKAQPTIAKLADRIAAWDKAGHPAR
jgi:glutathione synthase/RimK-type ligase-like ATP-grasp enzyme